jgi:hypothetical protein
MVYERGTDGLRYMRGEHLIGGVVYAADRSLSGRLMRGEWL